MEKSTAAFITTLFFASSSWAGLSDMLKETAGQFTQGNSSSISTSALSESEIGAGLKEALSIGAEHAVDYLGKPGGFLNDSNVRIPLPGSVDKIASGLRAVGQGALVDEFELTMNRAAEEAIPQTLDIIQTTVQNMTLEDVRGILSGGDDAATQFLRKNTWDSMHGAVMPIVTKATNQTGATASYKKLTSSSGGTIGALGGLLGSSSDVLNLDSYVTDKTLDGMFYMLAKKEKDIRNNPLAQSTDLLKQVFGN